MKLARLHIDAYDGYEKQWLHLIDGKPASFYEQEPTGEYIGTPFEIYTHGLTCFMQDRIKDNKLALTFKQALEEKKSSDGRRNNSKRFLWDSEKDKSFTNHYFIPVWVPTNVDRCYLLLLEGRPVYFNMETRKTELITDSMYDGETFIRNKLLSSIGQVTYRKSICEAPLKYVGITIDQHKGK